MDTYPEVALFTDAMQLQARIAELPPLTPCTAPSQREYRRRLLELLRALPDLIPGSEDQSSSSSDSDESLNLLVHISLDRLYRSIYKL
jgi:hypothetical protein